MSSPVTKIHSRTEQRIRMLLSVLQDADRPLSYEELRRATGAEGDGLSELRGGIPADTMLYLLHAWEAVGLVQKTVVPLVGAPVKGRPRFLWRWVGDRILDLPLAVGI